LAQWTRPEYDITFVAIIVAFCCLYFGFLMLIPGYKFNSKTLYYYIAITVDIWIGFVIVMCQYAPAWQSDQITSDVRYAPYDPRHINATIGINIGLYGVNITLKGNPVQQFGQIIDYNEEFRWGTEYGQNYEFQGGRFGYGPYGLAVAQKYREWQVRGFPYPIMDIAEYFTLDSEDLRWGRWYRIAGWYTHIILYTCMPLWVIMNCVFAIKPSGGGAWLIVLGTFMEFAVMMFGIVIQHLNKHDLQVPFPGGVLYPTFDWCFYFVLLTGVGCILIGIAIMVYMSYYPEHDRSVFEEPLLETAAEKVALTPDDEKNQDLRNRNRHSHIGYHTVKRAKQDQPMKMDPTPVSAVPARVTIGFVEEHPIADVGDIPMDRLLSKSARNDGHAVIADPETEIDPQIASVGLLEE